MSRHKHIVVSKRLVAINSASSVASRILNITVLFWMFQYLLKRIPPEEFAVYPVVSAIIVFVPIFFTFFSGGISRYIIDAYAQADFEGVGRIVSSILPLLGLASLVFLTTGLMFALNIEHVLNIAPGMVEDAQLMMSLLVISFAIQMALQPLATAGYQVRQRYVELNLLAVLRDLLRVGLLLGLLLGISPSVVWVVVATVVSDAGYLAATLLRSLRLVPEMRFVWRLFEIAKARTLMSFGLWTTVGRLGSVMYTNSATIILNLFGTPVDVTTFYIGATIFRQLQTTINTALMPLQPALTAMNALNDHNRLASTVYRAGRYALWASYDRGSPIGNLFRVLRSHLPWLGVRDGCDGHRALDGHPSVYPADHFVGDDGDGHGKGACFLPSCLFVPASWLVPDVTLCRVARHGGHWRDSCTDRYHHRFAGLLLLVALPEVDWHVV